MYRRISSTFNLQADKMTPEQLTAAQLNNFSTIERTCSTLSLLGCAWVVGTFCFSRAFHKPINRLVFYASLGNIMTNAGTLISRAAVTFPRGGLCQFQAFLIQMFMPADAYWTLAMAANVYLTFYWKFDASKLRHLEIYYFILCYGVPFVPAFVYLFAKSEAKGRMYGNATLWCWIDSQWDVFRIATFYGPVWMVILATIMIYARAGKDIYTKRKSLRDFSRPAPDPLPILGDPFQSIKTTEVFVTSEAASPSPSESSEFVEEQGLPKAPQPTKSAYTVTVSSTQERFQQPEGKPQTQYKHTEKPLGGRRPAASSEKYPTIPASAYMPNSDRSKLYSARRHAASQADNAAWSYTKVAVLFFIAMMVTWIPSSANRVYSVIHTGQISLGLEYASAFVLPLQGFWNAVIYTTTSLPACRIFWCEIRNRKRMSTSGLKQTFGGGLEGGRGDRKLYIETDSMTELQPNLGRGR